MQSHMLDKQVQKSQQQIATDCTRLTASTPGRALKTTTHRDGALKPNTVNDNVGSLSKDSLQGLNSVVG